MSPVLWMVFASLSFASMGAFVKLLSHLPTWELVFFRSLVNLLWVLPWVPVSQWRRSTRKENWTLLVRGVSGTVAMALYYYAIQHIPLADAVMLNYSAPIVVLVLSALFLKEKLTKATICFIVLAFLGISLILKPDLSTHTLTGGWAGAAGLGSAILAGIAYISIKLATRTVHPNVIVVSFAAITCVISVIPTAVSFVRPNPLEWLYLLAGGTLASIAQSAMTRGYAGLPATVASPLSLLTVVFSTGIGWVFWAELPDAWSLIGILLVATGLIGAYRFRWRPKV